MNPQNPSDPNNTEEITPEELLTEFVRTVEESEQKLFDLEEEAFGEKFETDGLTFTKDIQAYDQTAYAQNPGKSKQLDLYRYNLDSAAKERGANASWYNTWYSGYSTPQSALDAVHRSVCTQIKDPHYRHLIITNDLDFPELEDQQSDMANAMEINAQDFNESIAVDRQMVVRIDSSLYVTLGIEEAQQHYVVDGIAQVLALQSMPFPVLGTYLQCKDPYADIDFGLKNLRTEVITEIIRCRGLDLIVEEMPGWLKRVTALRAAMYVEEPPENDIPAAFLLYAVWERDIISSEKHREAIKVIESIEKILFEKNEPFDLFIENTHSNLDQLNRAKTRFYTNLSIQNKAGMTNARDKYVQTIIHLRQDLEACTGKIGKLIKDYAMKGLAGSEIVDKICATKKLVETWRLTVEDNIQVNKSFPVPLPLSQSSIESATPEDLSEAYIYPAPQKISDQLNDSEHLGDLLTLVHDHNRTYQYSAKMIRHQDFPSCSNKALLPSDKRARVELSRKAQAVIDKVNAVFFDSDYSVYLWKELAIQSLTHEKGSLVGHIGRAQYLLDSLLDDFHNDIQKSIQQKMSNLLSTKKLKGNQEEGESEKNKKRSLSSYHDELIHRGAILNNINRGSSESMEFSSRKRLLYNIEETDINQLQKILSE